MNYHRLFSALCAINLLSVFLIMSGCGGNRPDGFPDLVAYTLKVEKDGQPIQNAAVNLVPDKAGQLWTIGGSTDKNGIAILYTHMNSYMEKGVPDGNYKVTISKVPEVSERLPKEKTDKMSREEFSQYTNRLQKAMDSAPKEVPPILSSRSKTPLTISVSTSSNSFTAKLEDYH